MPNQKNLTLKLKTIKLKLKRWKEICHSHINHKAEMVILISEEANFNASTSTRNKDDYFIIMNQFIKKTYKCQEFMYTITQPKNNSNKVC